MSIAQVKLGRMKDCVADDDIAALIMTAVRPTADSGGNRPENTHGTISDDSVDITFWPTVATALQIVQIHASASTDGMFVR